MSNMKQDVRFLKREVRNARVSKGEVQEHLNTLADAAENARWMHPDGTPCDDAETDQLFNYHEAGNDKLKFANED